MPKISIQSPVSPGQYSARFVGAEDRPHLKYGPRLRFWFEIVSGSFSGQRVCRIANRTSTGGDITGRLLAGLAGRPPIAGEDVEVNEFIGSRYVITVELDNRGWPRVTSVRPENID
jgi:hypothetical protein